MVIFYFTGTGNSLAVAKRIGGELVSIPQAVKNGRYAYADAVIGFVFPTYCCYPPQLVREFLARAQLKADYLFAVATYGNSLGRGGDGAEMQEFGKLAKAAGYDFHYLNSLLMVDNFIDAFDMGREIERLPSKQIDRQLAGIVADIAGRRRYVKDPGLTGRLATAFCRGLVKKQDQGLTAQAFTVDQACSGCGVCARVCPAGNISLGERRPQFGRSCQGCYACLHNCPQAAIHKRKERSAKRWRHPQVSLAELMAANDQRPPLASRPDCQAAGGVV